MQLSFKIEEEMGRMEKREHQEKIMSHNRTVHCRNHRTAEQQDHSVSESMAIAFYILPMWSFPRGSGHASWLWLTGYILLLSLSSCTGYILFAASLPHPKLLPHLQKPRWTTPRLHGTTHLQKPHLQKRSELVQGYTVPLLYLQFICLIYFPVAGTKHSMPTI